MSNTSQRIIAGGAMAVIAVIAAICQGYFGLPAVRWLGCLIASVMIFEMVRCFVRAPRDVLNKNKLVFFGFTAWLLFVFLAINSVGARPWVILLLLLIISAADIGGWFFGRLIGGDKMWPNLSAGKTWSGQIAGILCGTGAAVLYGLLGTDMIIPQLIWIGISVSLLSQYGDLTASAIKRRLGIKDFGNILPGHGGMLDRFDGWIYALPLVWYAMM